MGFVKLLKATRMCPSRSGGFSRIQQAHVTASHSTNARVRSKRCCNRPQQMSAHAEEILHDAVHRREALQLAGRLEAAHLALALPGRLVSDFRAIVGVLGRDVDDGGHHGPAGPPRSSAICR